MKPIFSVVAPMYNEQTLVEKYCQEVINALKVMDSEFSLELVLINDGSKDFTWSEMKKMQSIYPKIISTINLSRNFGLEGAVYAGLKMAKGDIVVVMDADLQDPPSTILEMYNKFKEGYDVVVAKRKKRLNDNFFKRFSANLYYIFLEKISGRLHLERNVANFRMLSKRAVKQILSLPEVNSVFRIQVPFIGMKTGIVEYERDIRFSGKTKYNLTSMVRYALDSFTSMSIEPLRYVFLLSFFSLIVSFFCVIIFFCTNDSNKLLFFLASLISFFSFIILFGIGIIGEYIAQIFLEVKGRPISIIENYESFIFDIDKEK